MFGIFWIITWIWLWELGSQHMDTAHEISHRTSERYSRAGWSKKVVIFMILEESNARLRHQHTSLLWWFTMIIETSDTSKGKWWRMGGVRGGQAPKTMSDQLMNSRPGGLRIHDGSAEYRCWWMETDEVGISTGAPSPRAPSRWTWLFVYQTLWRNRLIGWTGLNKVFICDVQIFCNNNCWAETPTRSLLGDLSNWVVQIAGICWPLLSYSLAIWILRLFQPGSRWWRVKKKRWKKQIRSFGMPYLLPLSAWTFHHWTIIHLSGPVIYLRLWSWQMLAHWPEELWLIRSSGEIPTRRQRWIRIRIPQVTAGGRNMTWRKEPAPKIACIIRLNWDEVRKFDMCMYIW